MRKETMYRPCLDLSLLEVSQGWLTRRSSGSFFEHRPEKCFSNLYVSGHVTWPLVRVCKKNNRLVLDLLKTSKFVRTEKRPKYEYSLWTIFERVSKNERKSSTGYIKYYKRSRNPCVYILVTSSIMKYMCLCMYLSPIVRRLRIYQNNC